MPENKVQIVVEVDAATGRATIRQLGEEMETAGRKGAAGFGEASTGVDRLGDGVDRLKRNLSPVIGLASKLGMAWGTAEIIQTADAMRAMDTRLLLTARNTADYVAGQQDVVNISHQAHQELSGVATLYNRIALSTANLNIAQTDLADVTKTVALSVALSGSASQESAAGMLQFAQAMGSGRLQGDELRSVMENMPQLAKILVDAAGGSMAQFREMAKNGELTTEWMVNAIKKALPEMEAMAAGMPITIGMAVNDFKTSASQYIATVDAATGSSAGLAAGIGWLGQNLETVAEGGVMILTGWLSMLAGRGIASVIAAMPGMIAAVREYATVTETATVVTNAYSIATETTSRVSLGAAASRLMTMPNIVGAVTTALTLGATAWAIWGNKGEDASKRIEQRLKEAERYNRMMKEMSDPGLRQDEIIKDMDTVASEIDRFEKRRAKAITANEKAGYDMLPVPGEREIADARKNLASLLREYEVTSDNIALAAKQGAGKRMATELSVSDFEKQQAAERTKATADALTKKLLDIEEERQAELAIARDRFKNADDLARAEQAVNSRFDAEKTTASLKAQQTEAKKAAAHARTLAEEWAKVKLELTDEAGAVALTGLDHELAEIDKKADKLRQKFGNRTEIDAWQAEAENAKIQADYRERQKKQIEAIGKAQKEWDKATIAGLSEQDQAIAKVHAEFDQYRAAITDAAVVLNKPMAEVYDSLESLGRAEAEAIQKVKDKSDDLSQFQIQAFRNMQDAGAGFFESLRTGSDDWQSNFERMTLKMVDQWASAQMMMGLAGEDFGKGGALGGLIGTAATSLVGMFGGGGIGSAAAPGTSYTASYDSMVGTSDGFDFSSMFGGGRESGGPVSAGKIYEVNEQNIPELLNTGGRQYLMMGAQGGRVTPVGGSVKSSATESNGGGAAPISITIIAADAQSITEMMRRNPQAILGPLRAALQGGDRGLRADLQRVIS